MYRLLVIIALITLSACTIAYGDTETDLLALQQSLPSLKASLDAIKANGQDTSYPMINYTVLENFVGDALMNLGYNSSRVATELSELQTIKTELDQQISQALAGNIIFPVVPRWTGDTRSLISGCSFMAPTITPGSTCREIRPVFFTGFGHFAQVREDMEKWPNYGTNMVQFETGPNRVYPDYTEIPNMAVAQGIKADLDRAQKAGVAVDLLISPHYFPAWMISKYPELNTSREGFLQFCIHAPSGQEFLKEYIRVLLTPIKNHPALHSICLTNEPRNVEKPCEYATAEFRTWLQQRHSSIDVLNDRWGTSYTSFDQITIPMTSTPSPITTPIGRWVDYCRWNQECFTNWHKVLADAVHAVAPNVYVHAKVQGYTFGNTDQIQCGNDPYLYAGITDLNGNDGSNYYRGDDATLKPYYANWLGCYMYGDMQRSMRDAPIFNSENHLMDDVNYTTIVPWQHIRTALWQEAIHGQGATTLWVWDHLSGFYMERPLDTKAVGTVNCDLNRAAKEVTALQQVPEQVTILHPFSSLVRDSGHNFDYIAMRAYWGLTFCRVRTGFITERQLEAGILPKTSILIVPNAKYITDAAFETLKNYQGHIIYLVDGNLLCYDEYGQPRSEQLANVDVIPFAITDAKSKNFYTALLPKLIADGLATKYNLVDSSGNSLTWGAEFREAETSDGDLVNVCDYLYDPISVKLTRNGQDVTATDVLTGETITGFFNMNQFDFRLLKIQN